MSNVNVTLDCRNRAAIKGDGYTTTTSSIGTSYSFNYSGGTDGHGGVVFTEGDGGSTLQLSVLADPRYVIQDITFTGDNTTDLSWTPGNTPTTAVIHDTDVHDLNDEYTVLIRDKTANCTIPCDPPIRNEPPS